MLHYITKQVKHLNSCYIDKRHILLCPADKAVLIQNELNVSLIPCS